LMAHKASMSRDSILEFLNSQLLINTPFPATVIQLILSYWEASVEGKFVRQLAGLNTPMGITGTDGIVVFSEFWAHQVSIVNSRDLSVLRTIGEKNLTGVFNGPYDVLISGEELFIADYYNYRIQVYNMQSGVLLRTIGKGNMGGAISLAIHSDEIIALERDEGKISAWNLRTGTFIRRWGKLGDADSDLRVGGDPSCIFLTPSGELFVTDTGNGVVKVFTVTDGTFKRKFGLGILSRPTGLTLQSSHVYVADQHYNRIAIFDNNGEMVKTFGEFGRAGGLFDYPCNLTITEGNLIVSDLRNGRLQWFC